jgi:hypothetical protein
VAKDALGEKVGDPGEENAAKDGLHDASGEGMDSEEGVYGGEESGVEEGPVGGRCPGRGEGVPGLVECVAVASGEPSGELRVRVVVRPGRDGVAEVEGNRESKTDGDRQNHRYENTSSGAQNPSSSG